MITLRVLAIAATSRRIGYVFLVNGDLKEWRTLAKPAQSNPQAAGALQELINTFEPDIVVTEDMKVSTRKGKRARALTQALQRLAAQNYVLDVSAVRVQSFANKYEEAEWLASIYESIKPWVPQKRRHFDNEPDRMVTFDALALAHSVLQRPTSITAAMS